MLETDLTTDWQLLKRYTDHGSEAAFTRLVERHKKLVYWTCRREISDAQMAEDATQAVFIVLARKAPTIRKDASLAGWLFSAARHVSRNVRTCEMRRRRNEESVALQMQSDFNPNAAWKQVELLLNDALSSLSGSDRNAVLLRYTEGCSFPEIAGLLGTTEEAARKRVNRSLNRLQRYFSKRDVSIAAAALGAILLERSASAMPETAMAVNGTAILAAASAGGHAHAALLTKGLTFAMEATKKKILISSAAAAVLSLGVTGGIFIVRNAHPGSYFNDPTFGRPEANTSDTAAHAAIDAQYRVLMDAALRDDMDQYTSTMSPTWTSVTDDQTTTKRHWMRITRSQKKHPSLISRIEWTVQSFTISGREASVTLFMKSHQTLVKQTADNTGTELDKWRLVDGKWLWDKTTTLSESTLVDGKPVQ